MLLREWIQNGALALVSDLEGNHSRCHQITEVDGPMIHRYRVRNAKARTDTTF